MRTIFFSLFLLAKKNLAQFRCLLKEEEEEEEEKAIISFPVQKCNPISGQDLRSVKTFSNSLKHVPAVLLLPLVVPVRLLLPRRRPPRSPPPRQGHGHHGQVSKYCPQLILSYERTATRQRFPIFWGGGYPFSLEPTRYGLQRTLLLFSFLLQPSFFILLQCNFSPLYLHLFRSLR